MARIAGPVHGVWQALVRLRNEPDSDALLRAIPAELCASLGFTRATLLRLDEERLTVLASHSALASSSVVAAALDFDALEVEIELLRRRDLVSLSVATIERWGRRLSGIDGAFVSAPLILGGRVAGLLRADREQQWPPVDGLDLMCLWTFAEGAGSALERITLRKRMRISRDEILDIAATTDALFDEVASGTIEFASDHRGAGGDSHLVGGARLTAREAQVLGLIASGETNAGIARRLLISESTVKSHVKHILRKLDASHRAEAVSRYLAS